MFRIFANKSSNPSHFALVYIITPIYNNYYILYMRFADILVVANKMSLSIV